MIAALRRLSNRKSLSGFVAQAAVTWGAHVLTGTIAEQEEELEQLRGRVAELEANALADAERLDDALGAIAQREDLLREACRLGDVDLEQLVAGVVVDTYPAPRDVDPLEQGETAAADAAAAALPDTEPLTLTSQED